MQTYSAKLNAFAVAIVAIAIAGCGKSDKGAVRGTLLRQDGTPLAGARVVAREQDSGVTAYGTTDANGYFQFRDDISPGNYNISILEDRGSPDSPRSMSIAAKYQDPSKSGVTATVEAGGTTELNLTLDGV